MFTFSSLYITYLDDDPPVEPQAGTEVAPELLTRENLTFSDANSGFTHDTYTPLETTRSLSMPQDVPMGTFLSRPINIGSVE
jgi:hypothetical protein